MNTIKELKVISFTKFEILTTRNMTTEIPRLKSDPANEDFFAGFWTRIKNMDSANECFSGWAR